MGKKNITTSFVTDEALVDVIIEAIREKKGQRIVKIDLKEVKNTICDYFIICEGESNTQVNALADNIDKQTFLSLKNVPHHVEGRENAQWILLDYFSVIVHVFQKEQRGFYKLEDLWSDGKLEVIPE
jgi:ribosome-associated protein